MEQKRESAAQGDTPDAKRQRTSANSDESTLGSQTAAPSVQAQASTEFGIDNDQLDDILNDSVPGIDIKTEKGTDAINFDFDSLPDGFLDAETSSAAGLDFGQPQQPSRAQSAGPQMTKDDSGASTAQGSSEYANNAMRSQQPVRSLSTGNFNPKATTPDIQPRTAAGGRSNSNLSSNLNIYTGNGGINNVNAGTPVSTINRSKAANAQPPQQLPPQPPQQLSPQPPQQLPPQPHAQVSGGPARPMMYNAKTHTATPINRMNPLMQQAQGIQGLNTTNIDRPSAMSGAPPVDPKSQLHTDDPVKLNDALAAAGVDIQQEEELLAQQHAARNRQIAAQQQVLQRQRQTQIPRISPFINPYHLSSFMQRVARENGVHQNFFQDTELLELMSAACEQWLAGLATKTIILSRHRRRGIPTLVEQKTGKKGSITSSVPSNQRSEISRELRNLAVKQKEMEEKRVQKRIALGLEDGTTNGEAENGKAGAEETLHRAANATAAMMSNTGRKKYSWMTAGADSGGGSGGGSGASGAGGAGGGGGSGVGKVGESIGGKAKQSSILAARGDNGLRYREIRTGKTVTMKDLLGALEEERMGVERALIKGYAKLKD
ncbi:Transcription initiation factor TFIID subunit 4 [[Candida] zeylanoides]